MQNAIVDTEHGKEFPTKTSVPYSSSNGIQNNTNKPGQESEEKTPPHTKQQLDQLMIEPVIRDARCFTDFDKPGQKKFLQLALPGNELARLISESPSQSSRYLLRPTDLRERLPHEPMKHQHI